MSQRKKLEQVLEFLVNEETERATELLHDIVVEKARFIYESLMNEEDMEDEDLDEAMDGDMKSDFIGEIEADDEDIAADEISDGEVDDESDLLDAPPADVVDDDMDGTVEDEEVLDVVLDVKDQLEQLRAEFDRLMADEMGEPEHADMAGEVAIDVDDDDDIDAVRGVEVHGADEPDEMTYVEGLGEATQLQDKVPEQNMKKEGQAVGTGKNTKTGATGTESPYTKAPDKKVGDNKTGNKNFAEQTKGGEYTGPEGGDTLPVKHEDTTDNIDVDHKPYTDGISDTKSEGNHVGTGKNSKKGATQTDSLFTKEVK